jgi:ATP-dependent helicase/nuclease subunit B
LEGGATLIVPTRQRAAALRLAFAASQLGCRKRAWRTPDAIAYRAWLEREAFRAAEAGRPIPRPLRPSEEWLLWRQATQEAARGTEWMASDTLAEPLRRAARLMSDWRIPRAVLSAAGTQEGELLHRALQHLEARCRATGSAASHELAALLESWTPHRPLAFAGFMEYTPAQRALVEYSSERMAARATQGLQEQPLEASPAATYLSSARDASEELELAAEWCRSKLSADPAARLLVLVPDLAQRRAEALCAFGQVLDPRSAAVEGGVPLTAYPLVRHALTALRFLTGTLEFEALSAWLRGSFWRAPPDVERAQLDGWLRRVLQIEVRPLDLTFALDVAPGGLRSAAQAVEAAVTAAAHVLASHGEPARIARWARRFAEALRTLGWPGARSLSSAELQTMRRFGELLADFTALGAHHGEVPAREAVDLLEALAARAAFAPATGDAAVTLTDALADPVIRYEGIWVAGLHADAWPAPASLDPFIPLTAQRGAGIPWATAHGTLERARKLLRCWRCATPELILSWPVHAEDREYRASPLLAELPGAQPWAPAERRPRPAEHIRRARRIEWFEDATGDPWPAGQALPGGARALEHQSRCPFRAYAELRLSCAPMETPRPGVDPRERGRFLHRALELLWDRLRDSSALEAAHHAGKLGGLIEESVAQAARQTWAAPHVKQPSARAASAFAYRREESRAIRLLAQLAALELQRSAFRVSALELGRRLELQGAALDLRIDRLDELEDGSHIIFDYKSGRPSAPDWLADRITDPQLLAYLLAVGEEVVAIATVHLAADRVAYRGLSDRAGRLPHLSALSGASAARGHREARDAWQAQVARWRAVLERLARGFLSGSAAVDPVEDACRVCHLHAFCRIGELEAARAASSSADGNTTDADPSTPRETSRDADLS